MDLHNWEITFNVMFLKDDSLGGRKPYSDILNWVVNKEPVGFLSFRPAKKDNENEMKKIEFGYYSIQDKKWETGHSFPFYFLEGDYLIICKRRQDKLYIYIQINGAPPLTYEGVKFPFFTVLSKEYRCPENYFFGDILNDIPSSSKNISVKSII